MKNKMKVTAIMVTLLMMTAFTLTAATKQLTLQQAVNMALKHNTNLNRQKTSIDSAKVDTKQKKNNFMPQRSISITTATQSGKTYDMVANDYLENTSSYLTLKTSSSLNLFNGFKDISALKQSVMTLKSTEQSVERAKQATIFETLQRFFQVVTAQEAVKVEQENLKAQQLQAARIEAYCEVGKRAVTDLHQQKAEIAQAEYRLLNAQRNHKVAKLNLMRTIGVIKPGKKKNGNGMNTYTIASPNIDALTKEIRQLNKKQEIREAFQNRPDIKAAKIDTFAAQQGIKVAKSGYYPKLDLFTEIGTTYNSGFDYENFGSQLNGNFNKKIGLSLNIPVFQQSRTKNNVALARIRLKNTQLEMENKISTVIVEVVQAMEDYKTAAKQLDVANTQETFTLSAQESMTARYNVNAATMVDLTQTRTRHLDAQYDTINAKYNLLIQGAALAFYKGNQNQMMASVTAQ